VRKHGAQPVASLHHRSTVTLVALLGGSARSRASVGRSCYSVPAARGLEWVGGHVHGPIFRGCTRDGNESWQRTERSSCSGGEVEARLHMLNDDLAYEVCDALAEIRDVQK
jgi:hypothetical protein